MKKSLSLSLSETVQSEDDSNVNLLDLVYKRDNDSADNISTSGDEQVLFEKDVNTNTTINEHMSTLVQPPTDVVKPITEAQDAIPTTQNDESNTVNVANPRKRKYHEIINDQSQSDVLGAQKVHKRRKLYFIKKLYQKIINNIKLH